MWFALSKTVGRLLEPIGFIWLILLLALVRALCKRQTGQALFCGGMALFITVIGSTKLPALLLAGMEKPYAVENLESLPECDAVVVLGGTHSAVSKGVYGVEFGDAVDRIIMAAELVRQGRGNALVIGGGGYPAANGLQSEGILLKKWLESWKVLGKPIHDLGVNSNTRDEAVRTATLARDKGWTKIILVTSAWHMRRSEALFKKAGLEVIPVGADFEGTSALETGWDFYPVPWDAGFRRMAWFMHEQVGWWYYKFRGWV